MSFAGFLTKTFSTSGISDSLRQRLVAKASQKLLPKMAGGGARDFAGAALGRLGRAAKAGGKLVGAGAAFGIGESMFDDDSPMGMGSTRRRRRSGAPTRRDIQGCQRVQRFLSKFQSCGCSKRVPRLKKGRRA